MHRGAYPGTRHAVATAHGGARNPREESGAATVHKGAAACHVQLRGFCANQPSHEEAALCVAKVAIKPSLCSVHGPVRNKAIP